MGAHVVMIKHDPESHEYDCHDECTASLTCPCVDDACRCWFECATCRDATRDMDGGALDEFDDRLYEEGEAHGVEHQRIDGMWMTPTDRCIGHELETNASELIYDLPDGEHPVDLDCDDGFVYITPIRPAKEA